MRIFESCRRWTCLFLIGPCTRIVSVRTDLARHTLGLPGLNAATIAGGIGTDDVSQSGTNRASRAHARTSDTWSYFRRPAMTRAAKLRICRIDAKRSWQCRCRILSGSRGYVEMTRAAFDVRNISGEWGNDPGGKGQLGYHSTSVRGSGHVSPMMGVLSKVRPKLFTFTARVLYTWRGMRLWSLGTCANFSLWSRIQWVQTRVR